MAGKSKEEYEKVLESLITVDKYCHSIQCPDCPFYMMINEGECPLDKLGLGKTVYMEEVKPKAEERIRQFVNGEQIKYGDESEGF